MDLRTGLKKSVLASFVALGATGCAMSGTPAPQNPAKRAPAASSPTSTEWRLSVSPGESGTYQIHVADPSGRERQVLQGPDRTPPYVASGLVRLDDFSGDGKPDVLARGHSAGTSALTSEVIYVYDAASGRFLDAETFDNEGEVTKTGQGCIAVEHRNPDNMTYAQDAYCWKGAWVRQGSAR